MWNRAELKQRGKLSFTRNYWKCVLVGFIISLLTGTGSLSSVTNYITEDTSASYYEYNTIINEIALDEIVLKVLLVWTIIVFITSLIISIFIKNPMEIGASAFFINNAYEPARPGRLLDGFKNGRYWSSVLTVLLRNVYIFLWSLLLLIPGIIKSYEYRMVTYLLADHPEMSRKEAFKLSKEMMRGHKMNTFVLDLSFIGWYLLAAFTCGILNIFYVHPYVLATDAELYLTLRNQYFYQEQNESY